MTQSQQYTLAGGSLANQRLALLARILSPYTQRLFTAAGVTAGMHCLDMACGAGYSSLELAQRVGPTGSVLGLDMDDSVLPHARQNAEGLPNVRFDRGDVMTVQLDAPVDVVYTRFLLTHLADPQAALRQLRSVLKPGGRLIVEDIDFSGHFCYPPSDAYTRYCDLFQTLLARKGADANIGPKLPGMLARAGVDNVHIEVVQPAFMSGESKTINLMTLEHLSESLIAESLLTPEAYQTLRDELEAYTRNPNTLMSMTRVLQVWGNVN